MKLKKKTPNFKGQIKLIVAILYTKYKNMSMVGNNNNIQALLHHPKVC